MTPPRPVASPRTFLPTKRPETIWLTDENGGRVEVTAPRLLGDTLFGRTRGGEEVWVAVDETRIYAREFDSTKTFAVVGGTVLGGLLLLTLIGSNGEGFEVENVDRPIIKIPLFRR